MSKKRDTPVTVHAGEGLGPEAFTDEMNRFYTAALERMLRETKLLPEEKAALLDAVLKRMKAHEKNGRIS